MLCELLAKGTYTPQRPILAPSAEDETWRKMPGVQRVTAAADEILTDAPLPPSLPLTSWLAFSEKGDRAIYETPYFARRRALCVLVMAACATGEERYLRSAADYAWAICEETAWQLPAHNSYVRDVRQLTLPDPDRPIIDLFAAETGALLAMVYALLDSRLENLAPGLPAHLESNVIRRVLQPYHTRHFWWMADTDDPKDTPVCNWTPWCTQNVLLAAAVFESVSELPFYIKKAACGLDRFLDGYADDGCCDEGAQYYGHAALTFYNSLELLCRMAPGVFETAWSEPKLRAMAEYILHMHVEGPWYLNFSDCSPKAGPRGVREYLFARRTGSAALQALAAEDFARTVKNLAHTVEDFNCKVKDSANTVGDSARTVENLNHAAENFACAEANSGETAGSSVPKAAGNKKPSAIADNAWGISLYEQVQAYFAEPEILSAAERFAGQSPAAPGDIWYSGVGLLVTRRGSFVMGVKAGCNADSHNHNDTGSVTLYKNGHPLLIDVGVETYTRDTFSSRRYTIWTMQSSWHNLPEFDPEHRAYQQQPGPQACAADVDVASDLSGISMELAAAYGPSGTVPGLGTYRRSVSLTEGGLVLTDRTDYPGTVALTLMSVEPPRLREGGLAFGELAVLRADGAEHFFIEEIPVSDPRLRAVWPEILYRTRIYFHGRLRLEIS